jgi:CheY-like chemotaxis protein
MAGIPPALEGRQILIVEDEYLIATALARELEALGARIVGPVGDVDAAMEAITGNHQIDGAVLDINLHGVMSFDVAKALMDAKVPVIFTTGYDKTTIPPAYSHIKRCEKPVLAQDVADALFE